MTLDDLAIAMRDVRRAHARHKELVAAVKLAKSAAYFEFEEGESPYCMYCGSTLFDPLGEPQPHSADCLFPHLKGLARAYVTLLKQWDELSNMLDKLPLGEYAKWEGSKYRDVFTRKEWTAALAEKEAALEPVND